MRVLVITLACLVSLVSAEAFALGPLTFAKGAVRLEGGADDAANRTLWTRGSSLVIAFPGSVSAEPQTLKIKDPLIKEARLTARGNRTELELRLSERAERVLARVRLETKRNDLVISFTPPPDGEAGAPPEERAERPTPTSTPTPAAAATATTVRPPAAPARPEPQAPRGWPPRTNRAQLEGLVGGKEPAGGRSGIWMLAVVAAGVGVGVWLLRRRRKNPAIDDAHIEVVTSRSLGAKQRLVLVEAGGELLLLGCTDKEIRLIRALDRRGLQRLQQSSEQSFFAEGAQIDAENAAASDPVELTEPRPPTAEAPAPSERFIERLSQQIQAREVEKRRAAEPVQPLDENWARGILKLRRAARNRTPPSSSSSSSSSSNETLH